MKQEIIELQSKAVSDLVNLSLQGRREISLKAPTGSGKTHIMAAFMDRMLGLDSKLIFIVSTLSKGKLAGQNFERFESLALNTFTRLNPFYISSGAENKKNTEYSIYIDPSFNVFVLPTMQYTKVSRINKEKSLLIFLETCKNLGKKIILIKDESHMKTSQLDKLSGYFTQIIGFSATPKDDKFDVDIKESEAVEAKLIKRVEFIDEEKDLKEGLSEALEHFKVVKKAYENSGINPAFIIQISNKDKAEKEVGEIKEVLKEKDLRWVYFVEKESAYDTNSRLKNVKNKSLWQNYVKQDDFPVDVVIFKMVITEGFDMPRACMLYQVRNSQSKQLDEQVIGRVRRNPCLSYFEKLDSKTQEIFSTAYVYGIKPREKARKKAKLRGGEFYSSEGLYKNEIIMEFKPFKITELKEVPLEDIDIQDCLKKEALRYYDTSIFNAFRKLQTCSDKVKEKQKEFVDSYEKWFLFNANLEDIKEKAASVVEDYEKYAEVREVELRSDIYSFFDGSDRTMIRIKDWIWTSDDANKFSFDSEAEEEWFYILDDLTEQCCKTKEMENKKIYLFGKNFLDKSNVRFDYYNLRKHTSYPDFIFKDKQERVHLFEVKSVNQGRTAVNDEEYKTKIEKLQEAYKYASKKTGYIFYLPIKGNTWTIFKYENGTCEELSKESFESYMKSE